LWWDLGTSPVLTKDCVVIAVMESGPSYLAAFDKKSGEEKYKADRNLGAPSEAAQSYSTPVVVTRNGLEMLIVLGADHVTAHDAATGKELWRIGGLNPTKQMFYRSIASAVVTNDMVIAPYARAKTITGIRLGGSGDVTQSHVVWTKEGLGTDVPTPAAVDGKVYVCGDRGEVACLDAASGETLWEGKLEKKNIPYSSSPLIADGKIYLTREDGTTFVVEQGKEFKLLETNEIKGLDGEVVATPVAVDGQILLRTPKHLYCFGKK
jgi:outer membrane protein assembly factor BamB